MNYLYRYTEVNISSPFGKSFKSIAILESGFCRYASPDYRPSRFHTCFFIMMYFTFFGKRVTKTVSVTIFSPTPSNSYMAITGRQVYYVIHSSVDCNQ